MLTGEYFVLDGALALALPCQRGQQLVVDDTTQGTHYWKSYDDQERIWFEVRFDLSLRILTTSDQPTALRLQQILQYLQGIKPTLFTNGLHWTTRLSFPRRWGLGTSSTLLHNLAQWAEVNPYHLLFETMGGSGYDIACAGATGPIYYFKSKDRGFANSIPFSPDFRKQLYFVYLNKKQDSRAGIAHYKKNFRGDQGLIQQVSDLTQRISKAASLSDFAAGLLEHEMLLAKVLSLPRAQDLYFADYPGVIKSLGAWGGDFVLATSEESPSETLSYFKQKGFETVLSYNDMILN